MLVKKEREVEFVDRGSSGEVNRELFDFRQLPATGPSPVGVSVNEYDAGRRGELFDGGLAVDFDQIGKRRPGESEL